MEADVKSTLPDPKGVNLFGLYESLAKADADKFGGLGLDAGTQCVFTTVEVVTALCAQGVRDDDLDAAIEYCTRVGLLILQKEEHCFSPTKFGLNAYHSYLTSLKPKQER